MVVTAKKIILFLIAMTVFSIILTICAVVYTERPQFCNSCHNMKPYYEAWRKSSHKEVNCLECHYEPTLKAHFLGKINGLVQVIDFITGRYSERAVAKINDASCLRSGCHDKEKLKDKKIMFGGKVEYRHASHWKDFDELGKGVHLRCTTCHSWLTYDKHISVDQNTCLICHFKNVPVEQISTQCRKCHTEVETLTNHKDYLEGGIACTECHTTIKTTNAPVLKQMCYFCHADSDKINKADEANKTKNREFLHQRHITENNADCINCHELIQHGKES